MAGEVIFAKLSQLEAFGTKVVTDFAALTARVQSLERAGRPLHPLAQHQLGRKAGG